MKRLHNMRKTGYYGAYIANNETDFNLPACL